MIPFSRTHGGPMADDPAQLTFPYPLDANVLDTYLTQSLAIEDEYDRLREMQRQLDMEYKPHLPLRAVRTAIKVIRARRKLEHHAKEPMGLVHQTYLEHM